MMLRTLLLLLLLALSATIVMAASIFGSPEDNALRSMAEAGNNSTMVMGLEEERNGDVDLQERPKSKCVLTAHDKDLECTYVCYPFKGECKRTSSKAEEEAEAEAKAHCMCTETLHEKLTCDRDDECVAEMEHSMTCECGEKKQCNCKMRDKKKDFAPLWETSLIYVSQKLCKTDGKVNTEACPNQMAAACLLILDTLDQLRYQYHCVIKSGEHRGLMTLTDANRIYVPKPSREDLMSDALHKHSSCVYARTCPPPEKHIPFMGFSEKTTKKPYCKCLDLDGTSDNWGKAPLPCRMDGKFQNLEACKKTCKDNEEGHCEPLKGEIAGKCICSYSQRKHIWNACLQSRLLGPAAAAMAETYRNS